MSTGTRIRDDVLLDLQGNPLRQDAANLLRSLDRLLTIGTYYSADHSQYHAASERACDAIVESIGAQGSVVIEIVASGMMVLGQVIDPRQRLVRQLHELLVPLNIARLEIDRELEPAHLRAALAAFHEHRISLGNSTSFQEIQIEGLPPTVRILSAQLVSQQKGDVGEDEAEAALAGLTGAGRGGGESPAELARRFLSLADRIIANLRAHRGGHGGGGRAPRAEELDSLAVFLRDLAESDPDPQVLLGLIQDAQQALSLSADPAAVDLVFRILRKEKAPSRESAAASGPRTCPAPGPEEMDAFRASLLEVAERARAAGPLAGDMTCDFLGICFQILSTDPADSLRVHLKAALAETIADPDQDPACAEICAKGLAHVMEHVESRVAEQAVRAVHEPLSAAHPDWRPAFWRSLRAHTGGGGCRAAWPHLAHDFLSGLGEGRPEIVRELADTLGSPDPQDIPAHREALLGMPVFAPDFDPEETSTTIFTVPPQRLAVLHGILMDSPLAGWHGPRLHRALARHPVSSLVGAVVRALGDHDPANRKLYTILLQHPEGDDMAAADREAIARMFDRRLRSLSASERNEDWVPWALIWAGRLDAAVGRPLAERVLGQRRLVFFRAWPAAVREAAERMVTTWNSVSAT